MLNIRAILHGADFSSRSDCAFRLACSLAKDHGARFVVLHVVSPAVVIERELAIASRSDLLVKARQKLEQLVVADADVQIERRLAEGSPSEEILRIALTPTSSSWELTGGRGRRGYSWAVSLKMSCGMLPVPYWR